eukprot:2206817-Heterocapsa_arctica.AAC.1
MWFDGLDLWERHGTGTKHLNLLRRTHASRPAPAAMAQSAGTGPASRSPSPLQPMDPPALPETA